MKCMTDSIIKFACEFGLILFHFQLLYVSISHGHWLKKKKEQKQSFLMMHQQYM